MSPTGQPEPSAGQGMPRADRSSRHDVFISYSSKNKVTADAVCAVLEQKSVRCWVAPRDIMPGADWGESIVKGINEAKVFVLIFSAFANTSQQIKREVERAVHRGIPIIPFRIEDVMPAASLEYFISTSHWLDAFTPPLERHANFLADTIIHWLQGAPLSPSSPPPQPRSRLRRGPLLIAACVVAAMVLAAGAGVLLWPSAPTGVMQSSIAGRWETKLPDGKGGQTDCVMDVQQSGWTVFSDDCPYPFTDDTGSLMTSKDATWAQTQFQPGDSGSFLLQGGMVNGYAGAFRLGYFGHLTTRDSRFGVLEWSKVSADKPLSNAAATILTQAGAWPYKDAAGIARRATAYVRSKWQSDAVLMSMDLKPGDSGGAGLSFTFYSPGQQQIMSFLPGSPGGAMSPASPGRSDVRQAIPAQFIDLPEAIQRARQLGMQGKQISEAKLEWSGGASCGTGDFRIDNAILPKCRPGRFVGMQWEIDSALGERLYIPAA